MQDVATGLFVLAVLLANVVGPHKVLRLPISDSMHISFFAGQICFPLSYACSAWVVETHSLAAARRMVAIGFLCLAISALFIQTIVWIPAIGKTRRLVAPSDVTVHLQIRRENVSIPSSRATIVSLWRLFSRTWWAKMSMPSSCPR